METNRRSHSPTHHVNWPRIVVAAVLLVVIIGLIADNTGETRVGYVFGGVKAPLFVLLIVTAVLGALIGWLVMYRSHHHDG